MRAVAEELISEEEFARLEESSNTKHEYYQGRLYAMSGGSNRHARLVLNAGATLRDHLRGKPCRAVGSEQRVKIEATGLQTYPDASVYRPPARFEGRSDEVLLTPTLIIEVLSPSTENYDRSAKFAHYQQIASLTDYILITQDRVLVEHFHRHDADGWLLRSYNVRESSVALPDLDLVLPLSELYEDVEAPAGLLPLRPEEEIE